MSRKVLKTILSTYMYIICIYKFVYVLYSLSVTGTSVLMYHIILKHTEASAEHTDEVLSCSQVVGRCRENRPIAGSQ